MFHQNGYLIKDYTNSTKSELYVITNSKEFFKLLDDVKAGKKLVAIYEIGDCVADWS